MIYYKSIDQEMKRVYGQKVYRISLNAGLSCPNRDGTIGVGGCIFCSEGGSGDFAPSSVVPISEQLSIGKDRIRNKAPNCKKFIAYFQAFTNTYGPIEYLRKIFYEAIEDEAVVVLSIATRPDCLGQGVLELLAELNEIKPVWIELGLQTIHSQTATLINRGYELNVYDEAVSALKNIGISVITHIILGLPGESENQMLDTVDYVCKSGVDGIKLQLLHILRNTKLEEMYNACNSDIDSFGEKRGMIHIMTMDEYFDLLEKCLSIIPPSVVIHRLTGDGPKSLLIEPQWTADKKRVLNAMKLRFCPE